jgi:hypothetical protein
MPPPQIDKPQRPQPIAGGANVIQISAKRGNVHEVKKLLRNVDRPTCPGENYEDRFAPDFDIFLKKYKFEPEFIAQSSSQVGYFALRGIFGKGT